MSGANHGSRNASRSVNEPGTGPFRAATLVVALALAWLAFRPATGPDIGLPWDKANHCCSFLVLTLLTARGWPRLTAGRTAAIMLAAGIGIELVQGLPAVGRDADVRDVVADMVGFVLGWGVLILGRRRGWPGFRG